MTMKELIRIIRIRALCERIGRSRSFVYECTNPNSPYYQPDFPKPIKLGANAIGFVEGEVDAYLEKRIRTRDTVVQGGAR